MSARDKVKNATRNVTGKTKQAAGAATGDRSTEMSGRRDQVKADLRQSGEQVKDAGRKARDAMDH